MARSATTASTLGIIVLTVAAGAARSASPDELVWIARGGHERNTVLDAGVPLVAETEDGFFALGDPDAVSAAARGLGTAWEVVHRPSGAVEYGLASLRPSGEESDLIAACGEVVWRGDGWFLLASQHLDLPQCREAPGWVLQPLDLKPLLPFRSAPTEFRGLADGSTSLTPDPLVGEMVDRMNDAMPFAHWQSIIDLASTRHSTSQGCDDAATALYGFFDSLGLDPQYQHHTSGHAPNVFGTIAGSTAPDEVVIAVGHLDDMPSSGPAPGADDNASGSAMVTALAEAMSCYSWSRTVRFLAVTGEEFGLYGSDHYASQAQSSGENIVAVLNADMIGWEGDGNPVAEDLDVNTNSGSAWLGTLMREAAAEYDTGLVVNDFSCSSMAYSDHWPFWQNGWSAICGITDNEGFCGQGGSYPYYHTSADTIVNCGSGGPAFHAAAVRTYLATLAHLAQPIAAVAPPPTGVTAQPDGPNRVALDWDAMGLGTVYQVVRAPGGCSNPGPAVTVGQTDQTAFTDTTASGGVSYAYWIRGAEPGGCVSGLSTCVETSTIGGCVEPPWFDGAAGISDAGTSTCELTVNWDPPHAVYCGGEAAFNVYRSTDRWFDPSPATLVAEHVIGTAYRDTDVTFGDDFTYIVRAVDLATGLEDGNTARVTSSPTGPSMIGTWNDNAGDGPGPALDAQAPWHVAATGGHAAPSVYATGAYTSATCAAITTPPLDIEPSSQLSFWTRFDIEDDWDKGEVQISTDGGATWQRVPLAYPGFAGHTSDACGLPTGSYFSGNEPDWAVYTATLGTWSGQDVLLRWLLSSDAWVGGNGWWVDDIAITDVSVPGTCSAIGSLIFADGFESGGIGAWSD
jgi:hypothetical protein